MDGTGPGGPGFPYGFSTTVGAGALPLGWEPWPGAAAAGCAPATITAAAPWPAPVLSDADVDRIAKRAADIVMERIAELLKGDR